MSCRIRQFFSWFLLVGVILLSILLGWGVLNPPSAAAAIRQLEESPGQMVYQSRQTLKDQHGHTWQAIAFKRILTDGKASFDLRLVGFPGVVEIDRDQPLTLTDSLGTTLTAPDNSSNMFADKNQSQPHEGQYNLQPVLAELPTAIPIELTIPTTGNEPVSLSVSPSVVQEWQTVANQE